MTTMADLLSTYTTQAEMSNFFTSNLSIYNVKSYNATGNGSTDDYTSIYNCVSDAADDGGIVLFPTGDYKISSNLTIPSNVTVWLVNGAKILPDSGKTITINGSLMAPLFPIFTGNGLVTLNGNMEFHPQWWGAANSYQATTGSISAGETNLTVTDIKDFVVGHGIYVAGAGAAGAQLVSKVAGVSGTAITLRNAAGTTVTAVAVKHDDHEAIEDSITALPTWGGTILLPQHVEMAETIVVTSAKQTIRFKTAHRRVLYASDDGQESCLRWNGASNDIMLDLVAVQGLYFENITFEGRQTSGLTGIRLYHSTPGAQVGQCRFENCVFDRLGTGVNLGDQTNVGYASSVCLNSFVNCRFESCVFGAVIDADGSDFNIFSDNTQFTDNDGRTDRHIWMKRGGLAILQSVYFGNITAPVAASCAIDFDQGLLDAKTVWCETTMPFLRCAGAGTIKPISLIDVTARSAGSHAAYGGSIAVEAKNVGGFHMIGCAWGGNVDIGGDSDVFAANCEFLSEEGTTNLLTANQSSVETNTTGFTLYLGSTISRDTTTAWHGSACLKTVTPGAVNAEGFYVDATTVTAGLAYTASAWLKGSGTIRLYFRDDNAGTGPDSADIVLTSSWQRISLTRTMAAGATTATLFIRTNGVQAITFYADGMQIEQKAAVTSWILGGTTRATGDEYGFIGSLNKIVAWGIMEMASFGGAVSNRYNIIRGNFGIGRKNAVDATAKNVIYSDIGIAPTNTPVDTVQMWAAQLSAGKTGWKIRSEDATEGAAVVCTAKVAAGAGALTVKTANANPGTTDGLLAVTCDDGTTVYVPYILDPTP